SLDTLRHAMQARENTITDAAKHNYVPDSRIAGLIGPTAQKAKAQFDQRQAAYFAAHPQAQPGQGAVPGNQTAVQPPQATKLGPNGEGYDALPVGAQYIAPDGTSRTKRGR
ncbi:MAG TPA: hypothetical protein VIV09_08735, partial [Pseudolabrys sp.]